MERKLVGLCLLWGIALAAFPSFTPAAEATATVALDRPPLEIRQGRYFRWASPQGWKAKETTNGVDLFSPDGITFVSSALLHGSFGHMTPRDFLVMTMRQVNPSARISGSTALPSQPGIWGPWQLEDFDLAGVHKGSPVHMHATVGLSAGYGRYSVAMSLYQAPVTSWQHDKLWLPTVAQSIVVTNARQVAGQDSVMLPRNNPLDNSGLIESWRQKGLSEDRISQGRREGTMGYTRLEDPDTGQRYEMPFEAYDGGVGGYRNPTRPTELLRKLPPGY
ncbi:MAG: hypothetical protein HYS20_07435 [Rhodocyclales bacterium]|nr:hypothetical protein [Rhodocyclales bacterium]